MTSEQLGGKINDITHIDFFSVEEVERAQRLHAIKRFGSIEKMTHRSNVFEHALRTSKHSKVFSSILIELGVEVDLGKVLFFADHHDDPEIEMVQGDIPTPIKRSATPEERARMEQDERDGAQKVDRLVQKPFGFRAFPIEFKEYKSQKSLEARIVNYADKWDGLHEAVHEVVCGDNKGKFREVIREYKPVFEELNDKNKDWHERLKRLIGDDFFDVPDPDTLVPKLPEELGYKTAGDFMKSIAQGNPTSYFFG